MWNSEAQKDNARPSKQQLASTAIQVLMVKSAVMAGYCLGGALIDPAIGIEIRSVMTKMLNPRPDDNLTSTKYLLCWFL
jgi:hypothetical protein